ncbi:hypothetical protein Tco_0246237 [Tanacetum coccineum]
MHRSTTSSSSTNDAMQNETYTNPAHWSSSNPLNAQISCRFDKADKEYDQCVIDKKSLEIENKNLLIQNECLLAESVSKDICSVMLNSDIAMPMSVEPRSNYIKEHSRNLELEAEILKLKEELIDVRIKNDNLRDENVSIKKCYQDLYKSKAESNSNVSSRAAVREKPKVLAPGLYAMKPKFSKKPLTSYKHKDSKLKDTSTGSPPNAETKAVNDPMNANDLSANHVLLTITLSLNTALDLNDLLSCLEDDLWASKLTVSNFSLADRGSTLTPIQRLERWNLNIGMVVVVI